MSDAQPRQLQDDPAAQARPAAEGIGLWPSIVVMAALTALFLVWPLYRLFLPIEIHTNEPWNAWQIERAMGGVSPLYPAPDDTIANNYPPLYFYLIGLISRLTGDPIYTGRVVSLLAAAGLAVAVGQCIRQLGGSRAMAAFGTVWFLATTVRFFWYFAGMNDPHLLALAVMTSGLAWFLARLSQGRSPEPALAVMVLAGFIKHSLWATPVTALIWLAMTQWPRVPRALLVCALLTAVGLMACYATYGPDFFSNLTAPRVMTLKRGVVMLGRLQWIAIALAVWGLWAVDKRGLRRAEFSTIFIAAGFATYVVQSLGQGITINAQLELVAATAIGLALAMGDLASVPALRRFGLQRAGLWIAVALILRLVLSERIEPLQIALSPQYRSQIAHQVDVTNSEIARIRAIVGPVACTIPTVCYRAGKAFVFDDFLLGQRVATGRWTQERLTAALQAKGVLFETIAPEAEWSQDPPAVFRSWMGP